MALMFSKRLSDTDVRKRFAVPTHVLPHFGMGHGVQSVELRVKDSKGVVWSFGCTTRPAGYFKPVFQAGWVQFVRDRELQTGDKVFFYQEEDDDTGAGYRIEVQRHMRLMGKDMWHAVA